MKSKFEVIESSIPFEKMNEAEKKVLHEVEDLSEKIAKLLHKFEMENPGSSITEILIDDKGGIYIKGKSFRRPASSMVADKPIKMICTLVGEFEQKHPPCFISKIINSVEGVDVTVNTPPGYGSN